MSNSLSPYGLQPTRLLCPWDTPGKNTGVGCHFLLQGVFPAQRSNHISYVSCIGRQVLYHWCHLGSLTHEIHILNFIVSNLINVSFRAVYRKNGYIYIYIQWLGLHASSEGDMGSIPCWETKIPHATWHAKKKKEKKSVKTNLLNYQKCQRSPKRCPYFHFPKRD